MSEQAPSQVGRSVLFGLVLSASTLLMAAGRSKIVAVLLGPEGVGDMGVALQVARFAMVPATMVVGPALLRQMAIAHDQGDPEKKTSLLSAAGTLVLAVLLLALPLSIAIGAWAAPAMSVGLILAAAAARAGLNLAYFGRQVLVAVHQVRAVATVGVALAVLVIAGVAVGAAVDGLRGAFWGMTAGAFLSLPLYTRTFTRAGFDLGRVRPAVSTPFIKETAILGTASLAAAGFGQGALLLIRALLDREGGSELNGFFEAAWSISAGNLAFVIQGLGVVLLPRFAVAATPQKLQEEVEGATRLLLGLAIPGICLALALKRLAVVVLYSPAFLSVDLALGLMIVSTAATLVSWSQGAPLLYQGKVRAFVLNQVVVGCTLVGLSVLLVPHFGLVGVGMAYVWAYVQHVVVTGLTLSWACEVQPRYGLYGRTAAVCAAACGLVWLLPRVPGSEIVLGLVGLVLAWRSPEVHEVLSVITRRLRRS